METEELNLNKESVVGTGNNSKSGDGFIDRSKVRILLCDNDAKSSEEVFTLLLKCSYQGKNIFLYIYMDVNFTLRYFVLIFVAVDDYIQHLDWQLICEVDLFA